MIICTDGNFDVPSIQYGTGTKNHMCVFSNNNIPIHSDSQILALETSLNLSKSKLVILLYLTPSFTQSPVHSSPLLFDRRQLALTQHTEVPASVDPNERTYGRYTPFSLFLRLLGEH